VVTPESIAARPELYQRYQQLLDEIHQFYGELLDADIPAEDARFVLPNAATTKIVITMNGRELRHFFALRCCRRAQWEIQQMAKRMLKLVKPIAPTLFAKAGPGCLSGPCPEGKMTCGEAAAVREEFANFG
jgi:thymidylate synthase (FAD)